MNSYIQKEINRQYLKMTRPKANFRLPDLKAYYSVRNDLDYYRYNDAVMADLIRLNLKYFDDDRRMNRYLLFSQTIILPESWTRDLVKKSLNLTKRFDQTNPTKIHALTQGQSCIEAAKVQLTLAQLSQKFEVNAVTFS